jgi:hypothetical protein
MRSQFLVCERRRALGGGQFVEVDASLDGVVTEATSCPSREQRIVGETAPLLEPDPQDGDGTGSQRDATLLTALSKAADVRASAELDVATVGPCQLREPKARLDGERHEGVIPPTFPPVPIRSGKQCGDLLRFEERHVGLVEALLGNGQYLLDQLGMLGVTESGVSEQRPQRGETGVPAAGTVVPVVFEMVQEGRDHPDSEILPVESGGSLSGPALHKVEQEHKRVPIGPHRGRARLALLGEPLGKEQLHGGCDRAHLSTFSRRSAAKAKSSGAAERYQ